jgi:hypothetical protein
MVLKKTILILGPFKVGVLPITQVRYYTAGHTCDYGLQFLQKNYIFPVDSPNNRLIDR